MSLRLTPSTLSDVPTLSRYAALSYVGHLCCEGWIASSQAFLALTIIFAGLAVARSELQFRFHRIFVPISIYVIGSWISAAAAHHRGRAFIQAGEWFNFLSLVVAVTLFRNIPRLVPLALKTFAALAIFLSSYGLYQYFVLHQRDLEHRITGTTAHVMTYSGMIMPLSLLFLVLWLDTRKRLWMITGGLSAIALVLTFTRGAWIGWVVGAATVLVVRRARWFVYAPPIILLLLVLAPMSIFGRLVSVIDMRQSSNFDRVRMAQAGIEMIKDRPLFGVGPSNIKEIYPLYRLADAPRSKVPHLHNNLIQIWAERGIVCLAAYFFLIGLFLTICFRTRSRGTPLQRAFADGGMAAIVALFVAGLTEFNFGDTEVLLTMTDLMAVILVVLESPAIAALVAGKPGPDVDDSKPIVNYA